MERLTYRRKESLALILTDLHMNNRSNSEQGEEVSRRLRGENVHLMRKEKALVAETTEVLCFSD